MAKRVVLADDSKTILATAQMAVEDLVAAGVIKVRTYLNPAELLANLQGVELRALTF